MNSRSAPYRQATSPDVVAGDPFGLTLYTHINKLRRKDGMAALAAWRTHRAPIAQRCVLAPQARPYPVDELDRRLRAGRREHDLLRCGDMEFGRVAQRRIEQTRRSQ